MHRPLVYLAGPDVFLPDAREMGERKKALCARHGVQGLYPLDNALSLDGLDPPAAGLAIYRANCEAMRRADFAIANLTPFRGPSADAGTVFEVGFMTALGKPVFGYSHEDGPYLKRCRRRGLVAMVHGGAARDAEALVVEDFGLEDNLMIVGGVLEHGDQCTETRPDAVRWTDLSVFEACLVRAVARYPSSQA